MPSETKPETPPKDWHEHEFEWEGMSEEGFPIYRCECGKETELWPIW